MVAIVGIPLGFVRLHLGRSDEARALVEKGLRVVREIGDQGRTGLGLLAMSWVAVAEGAYSEADALLCESATLFRKLGQRAEVGQLLAMSGYVAIGHNQFCLAQAHLSLALRIGAELRTSLPVQLALPAMARFAADQGQPERALELYALALRCPFVANSRWFERAVGRRIAAAAAELPRHVAKAAQERGSARNLEATLMELLSELGQQDPVPLRSSSIGDPAD
jgi:hypothetical protein